MNNSWNLPTCFLLLIILQGCSMTEEFARLGPPPASTTRSQMREPIIARVAPTVRQDLDRLTHEAATIIQTAHENVEHVPARFKRRLVVDALQHPWKGLANLEGRGLLALETAEGSAITLPAMIDILEASLDRTSAFQHTIPLPAGRSSQDLIAFMVKSLEEASRQRDNALRRLSAEERQFLFAQAQSLVDHFIPHVSNVSDRLVAEQILADSRFAELIEERVDYANLVAAAQVLARLANQQWLSHLVDAFPKPLPQTDIPAGITGDVLYVEDTSYGLIVIGGSGPNTYKMDHRFGLIIDIGGDDQYSGMIGASTGPDHGNTIVIDMSGNDTYHGAALGLATGRLGAGLLIDLAGDDVYRLEAGSGGTGFGGLGILFDLTGDDVYMGSRLTQGAAIGGLGLLLDAAGHDRYTSHGFAIGFGGPSGVGAVIDLRGNDQYHCGNHYPSAYNAADAPNGKPGDLMFQYDCFGLGTGTGKRVFTKKPEWQAHSQAGGWGLLLDADGQDRYESANFSQGHGYFFGAGTFLDLAGDDDYQAARYGHGSSAHYGAALFIDRQGRDRYSSTGPFYNGGVAWDHGVSLMLDGGSGNDFYALDHSTGLGGADYSGWGLFIDEGGNDRYRIKSGLGHASEQGLAGFFDLGGTDTYIQPLDPATQPIHQPADTNVIRYPTGGLFVDR